MFGWFCPIPSWRYRPKIAPRERGARPIDPGPRRRRGIRAGSAPYSSDRRLLTHHRHVAGNRPCATPLRLGTMGNALLQGHHAGRLSRQQDPPWGADVLGAPCTASVRDPIGASVLDGEHSSPPSTRCSPRMAAHRHLGGIRCGPVIAVVTDRDRVTFPRTIRRLDQGRFSLPTAKRLVGVRTPSSARPSDHGPGLALRIRAWPPRGAMLRSLPRRCTQ